MNEGNAHGDGYMQVTKVKDEYCVHTSKNGYDNDRLLGLVLTVEQNEHWMQ